VKRVTEVRLAVCAEFSLLLSPSVPGRLISPFSTNSETGDGEIGSNSETGDGKSLLA